MPVSELSYLLVTRVFAFVALGAVLAALKIYQPKVIQFILKRIVVLLLLPLLIFEKVIGQLVLADYDSVLICFLSAILMVVISSYLFRFVSSRFLRKLEQTDAAAARSIVLANTFHNYGFIVYPLSLALYGQKALSLAFIFALTCDALFWSFGVYILQHRAKGRLKEIFNAPFISVGVSLALAFMGFKEYVSTELLGGLEKFNSITIPLALTTVGGVFFHSFKGLNFKELPALPMLGSLAMRTFFFPVLFLSLGLLCLPAGIARDVVLLEAIMPASIGVVVLVALYGGFHSFVVSFSVISNSLSVITIPLYLLVINFLRGH